MTVCPGCGERVGAPATDRPWDVAGVLLEAERMRVRLPRPSAATIRRRRALAVADAATHRTDRRSSARPTRGGVHL